MTMPRRQLDPETRHRVMASIRKVDTKPELLLRSALWTAGVRGWRCHARLPGTPDLTFPRWKVAVFVDGVWWHGHPAYLDRIRRRGLYWQQKIDRNMARDKRVDAELQATGWDVLRMWDLDVVADPGRAARIVVDALRSRGLEAGSSAP